MSQWLILTSIMCVFGALALAAEDTYTATDPTPNFNKPSKQYQWNRVPHGPSMWTPRFVPSLTGGVPSSDMFLPLRIRMLGLGRWHDMIERSGLAETLAGTRRFTVFAPTEDALRSFVESQGEDFMENRAALRGMVLSHTVPGTIMIADLASGMTIKDMAGGDLKVLVARGGEVTVGGARLAGRTGRDLKALNGMVHLIEDVIFPFAAIEEEEEENGPRLQALDDDEPELLRDVKGGEIRGINRGPGHRAWLGIPYAKPPIGDLRFAPPEPAESWEGTLETRAQPNACQASPDTTFGDFPGATMWNPNTDISEDCLYLNVHAPRGNTGNTTGKLPVLVWIYGGGYMTGSAALDVYDPEQYVDRGIVYVAMQYRLGAFGFLYLGKGSGAPGNVGMLDQVMALQWVKDNIEVFGGNPDDITLMGESAGANSVALHMVSPMSKGLFNKAILQSTGLQARWAYFDNDKSKQVSEALAKELSCDGGDAIIECLRSQNSSDILDKQWNTLDWTANLFTFVPTLDGEFLEKSPEEYQKHKAFNKDVPVLLGSNANEGFWSLMYYLTELLPNRDLTENEKVINETQYKDTVANVFKFYPKKVQLLIAHAYRNFPKFNAFDQMLGDSDFACSVESFADALSENGNAVFRYYYSHRSSQDPWPKYTGTKHGDELEFTFGHPLKAPAKYTVSEIDFANDIMTYWTNFVKTGNPNSMPSLTTWPKYEAPDWSYYVLNAAPKKTKVDKKRLNDRCKFWNELLPEFLEEGSECPAKAE